MARVRLWREIAACQRLVTPSEISGSSLARVPHWSPYKGHGSRPEANYTRTLLTDIKRRASPAYGDIPHFTMKTMILAYFLTCIVGVVFTAAVPSKKSSSVSPLQACLWQCGECFMDSDKLLMTCANDVCIQQKFPAGVMKPLMFKACPGLTKMFEYMKHNSN
ncbi:hypothetical protein LSH36_96g06022 [Paralvinella palmiformis]|uniref:Uncharacterized protein n=1 Tax=Paralvinella palmiformis TaxID=53620 RepID=A0AAD9K119_9ANNE|nr:hypothetical protein LSH36_96g06022 [Paralvinella palmiformis]